MNAISALPVLPFYLLARFRSYTVFLLILVISVSPRIHIGTLQYGKLLDVRYEDFLLIVLLISWFLYIQVKGRKITVSPLGKPIFLYLFLALVSTTISFLLGWIEPARAFFFLTKEVEYFLMFFATLNFIKDYKDIRIAIFGFLAGGLANGLYVLYQFLTGNIGGMADSANIYRYYGVAMLGESGPAVTGSYFTLLFLLSLTLFIFMRAGAIRSLSVMCIGLSIFGIAGSMSRTSVWAAVIVLPLYFYLAVFLQRKRLFGKFKILMILVLLLLAVFSFSRVIFGYMADAPDSFATRIIDVDNVEEQYYTGRVEDVYMDYLKVVPKNPILGLGKSITGQQNIPGVDVDYFYGEAHNQYLRILVEMGIVGLLAFIYLLSSIIKFSYNVFKDNNSYLNQAIGLVSLIYTVFLLVASLGQDVFIMARTIELYWIVIGLLMVVHRWIREQSA